MEARNSFLLSQAVARVSFFAPPGKSSTGRYEIELEVRLEKRHGAVSFPPAWHLGCNAAECDGGDAASNTAKVVGAVVRGTSVAQTHCPKQQQH